MRRESVPGRAIGMDPTDEQLMRDLAAGREEAVGPLYARYAPLVFGMAARAVEGPAAEEIVQDVFLTVWRGASTFDPERGPARPWLLQIARHRIANELRRRSRRPHEEPDPDGVRLASLPDPSPDQAERAWSDHRRSILERALRELPPAQRQALGLAYFDELSHGDIASLLGVPLGTAKGRIRAALAGLRGRLGPLAAALLVTALVAGLAVWLRQGQRSLARDERALTMLTSSDAVSLRLAAAAGAPAETHATYRFRPGSGIAVLTLSHFAPAPSGETYRGWALHDGRWTSLGTGLPDAAGRARFVAEAPALARRPEALEVTREPAGPAAAPGGPVVAKWPADHE
jgi:RNA polymerase sigma-70 factor (ECF subfamily)